VYAASSAGWTQYMDMFAILWIYLPKHFQHYCIFGDMEQRRFDPRSPSKMQRWLVLYFFPIDVD
jgi:hypothetical protein